jgi:hypothetical protein
MDYEIIAVRTSSEVAVAIRAGTLMRQPPGGSEVFKV